MVSPPIDWVATDDICKPKSPSCDHCTNLIFELGVRQGRVLSPRLFCSVLQLAMGRWRSQVKHFGLNLGDGPTGYRIYWICV